MLVALSLAVAFVILLEAGKHGGCGGDEFAFANITVSSVCESVFHWAIHLGVCVFVCETVHKYKHGCRDRKHCNHGTD